MIKRKRRFHTKQKKNKAEGSLFPSIIKLRRAERCERSDRNMQTY